jgi:tetratricopeptide (TPR) repeat protein
MPVSKNRRKNRKKAKPSTRTKSAREGSTEGALPPPPDRRALEGLMARLRNDLFADNHDNDEVKDAVRQAQEVMYDAWEAPTKRERVALAKRALGLSADCADAYVLLAQASAKSLVEARDLYVQGVAAGERALGEAAFEEDVGHFWGILETRPYMRARHGLAETLWALGERESAIAHLQDMLRLNPNDNQGLRYTLFAWFLALDDRAALDRLLASYPEDGFTEWSYAKALLAFRREGPSAAAKAALKTAHSSNPFVRDFLIGARPPPKRLPELYALGTKEEAAVYVAHVAQSWSATPGALEWLAKTVEHLAPKSRR